MKHILRFRLCSFLLLFALFAALSGMAQTHTPKYVSMSTNTKAYYEYLPEGYSTSSTTTYPLILFMTGIGEFGSGTTTSLPLVLKHGIPKLIANGLFPKSFTAGGATHRFIVITPQWVSSPKPTVADMDAVLNYIVSHYKVNTKRIYITGLSYGGGLSLAYAGNSSTYASRVAAVVPNASPLPDGGYTTIYNRSRVIAAGNVPVWAFHNSGDTPDSAARTIAYINYINQSPAPNPLARKTIFSIGGHDCWSKSYDPNYRENGYNMYEWMLLHQKGSAPPAANAAPTAYTGTDKTITLPTNSLTLAGSGTDNDGTISAYSWTKLSGPVEGTITSPTAASTTVTGLAQGIYYFRLMVSDNKSAKGVDDVKVTVNFASGTKAIQVNVYGGSNGYSSTAWNNWNVGTTAATNKTSSAFKYFDGTTSTVSAVLSATSAVSDNASTYATGVAMAPASILRYASSHTALRTLTLQGLSTTKAYNIELYASRSSSTSVGSTIYTINGVSATISATNNLTTKAKFTSVKPNSSGQIVVSINKSATYNYLNGFTLTESSGTTTSITAARITSPEPLVAANRLASAAAPGIAVFPNPVNSNVVLTLNTRYNGAVQVQVTDAGGKTYKVFRFVKSNPVMQQTLSIADVPGGVYFITVQTGAQRQTTRISKL